MIVMRHTLLPLLFILLPGCFFSDSSESSEPVVEITGHALVLTPAEANRLAGLPLNCIQTEFPNKLNQTLANRDEAGLPADLHPAFYGCFDWHSSVHGHWMLVKLLKEFPSLEKSEHIKSILIQNITAINIKAEVDYFSRESETGYERTYGWAWLLKLASELETWNDPAGVELALNLEPLVDLIVDRFKEFLPKLAYPIRSGEHTNTAFGLTLAYDYSRQFNDTALLDLVVEKALAFYSNDQNCPYSWEPGGYDFLSPCLEEVDLMRRVMGGKEFLDWLNGFYPDLFSPDFSLEPAVVTDRSDGKLVHLDGLNFSRAWCLYGLSNQFDELSHLGRVANRHIQYSLPGITDNSYEGEHWLASFAVYALSFAAGE